MLTFANLLRWWETKINVGQNVWSVKKGTFDFSFTTNATRQKECILILQDFYSPTSKRDKIVNLQRRLQKDIDNVVDSDDDVSEPYEDVSKKDTESTVSVHVYFCLFYFLKYFVQQYFFNFCALFL